MSLKASFITLLFITLLLSTSQISFSAATFKVESFKMKGNDLAARRFEFKDVNGEACALIKVQTDLQDLEFQSMLLEKYENKNNGEYWVYLQPGTKRFKIRKSGVMPLDFEFGLKVQGSSVYIMKLTSDGKTKKIENISVSIIAKPSGATIYLDNENKGKKKKIMTSIGKHELRIKKDGFQTISKTITVSASDNYFEYNLEEVEEIDIKFTSSPSGATVYLDDVKFGKTPISDFYPAGNYKIRLEKNKFVTLEETINIKAPSTKKNFVLQKNTADLKVVSSPEDGLDIYLNGEKTDNITNYSFKELKPGIYKIKAKSKYYETDEQEIVLKKGDNKTIKLKSVASFALLTINTHEKAEVFLNDERIYTLKDIKLEPQVCNIVIKMRKADDIKKRIILKKQDNKTLELYPDIKTGKVQISVIPENADIELSEAGGESYTAVGKKIFKDVPIGDYVLTVKAKGYKSFKEDITVTAEKKVRKSVTLEEGADVGGDMIFVEGGSFQMGSYESDDEKPIHSVTVSDFYIGKYEVTQKEWKEIMGNNPSYFKGDNLPVEQVSWNDIQEYLKKLNRKTGGNYRLPTEAEWEYAARGGVSASSTTYSGSDTVGDVAWCSSNSSSKTHSVGGKKPNELGIYDMTGNVWEWCSDWYGKDYYSNSSNSNPQGPSNGSSRVKRGGSWSNYASYCRLANRNVSNPSNSFNNIGFRVLRTR